MKDIAQNILLALALLAAGVLIGHFLWRDVPRETIRWETKIDSALVRIQGVKIDSLQGKISLTQAVAQGWRTSSKAWRDRAQALRQLADSMAAAAPAFQNVIALLDTVVLTEGRWRDSVGVKYDVGLDLWRDLRLSLAPRPLVKIDSVKIVEREVVSYEIPWEWVGPIAAVIFILGWIVGTHAGG